MSESDRGKWNHKYAAKTSPISSPPDEWLIRHVTKHSAGRALDLACGLGQNSIWLARQGWTVDAVDISPVGLALAQQLASQEGCSSIRWIEADLDSFSPDAGAYDLVVAFRFLDRRSLGEVIRSALRSGGWLIYETFLSGHQDRHPMNPAYLLQSGELPTLFPFLTVIEYQEVALPDRTVARLVAQKTSQF